MDIKAGDEVSINVEKVPVKYCARMALWFQMADWLLIKHDFVAPMIAEKDFMTRSNPLSFKNILSYIQQHRLSFQLLTYILLFSTLFALIITALQLYWDYRQDISDIEDNFSQIELGFLQSIAASAWNLDEQQLQLLLEGVLKLPEMQYVSVYELQGDEKTLLMELGEVKTQHVVNDKFNLAYNEELTIELLVIASLQNVYQQLLEKSIFILSSQALKTFIVSLFILLIVYFFIVRHLNQMAAYTRKIDLNYLDDELVLQGRKKTRFEPNEIDGLAESLNNMRINLREGIEERQDIENQLRKKNADLEQFAHVASHDLQEPLRKIQLFSELLDSDFKDELPEQAKDYLMRMQNAATRMRRLIDDLLIFSRVSHHNGAFIEIDMQKETLAVISDLEISIKETNAEIKLETLPKLQADPFQIRQLLQNIISNGLKFHKPGVPPIINIHGRILKKQNNSKSQNESVNMLELTITDNGIGFEPQYMDRIFEPFQRLHGSYEYEGNGIGLAVCKKIVERHYGTITAYGSPGEGSCFTIQLPIQQQKTGEVENVYN